MRLAPLQSPCIGSDGLFIEYAVALWAKRAKESKTFAVLSHRQICERLLVVRNATCLPWGLGKPTAPYKSVEVSFTLLHLFFRVQDRKELLLRNCIVNTMRSDPHKSEKLRQRNWPILEDGWKWRIRNSWKTFFTSWLFVAMNYCFSVEKVKSAGLFSCMGLYDMPVRLGVKQMFGQICKILGGVDTPSVQSACSQKSH